MSMVSTLNDLLQIGEVAHLSKLPVRTVRYYEDIDLLQPTVQRSESGYRLFRREVLNRLAFIKRAQGLGLSLQEIGTILGVHDQGELPCGQVKSLLETKLTAISAQIQSLETLQTELQGILSGWQDQPPLQLRTATICPNLQAK